MTYISETDDFYSLTHKYKTDVYYWDEYATPDFHNFVAEVKQSISFNNIFLVYEWIPQSFVEKHNGIAVYFTKITGVSPKSFVMPSETIGVLTFEADVLEKLLCFCATNSLNSEIILESSAFKINTDSITKNMTGIFVSGFFEKGASIIKVIQGSDGNACFCIGI